MMKSILIAAAILCATTPVLSASRKLSQGVFCCCRTMGGGQCCGQATMCTGAFVPGCICSPFHKLDKLCRK